MGLTVHQIMDEESDLKKKAEGRKKSSDEVLENVYSMLLINLDKKKKEST